MKKKILTFILSGVFVFLIAFLALNLISNEAEAEINAPRWCEWGAIHYNWQDGKCYQYCDDQEGCECLCGESKQVDCPNHE